LIDFNRDTWRVFKIIGEFVDGFESLNNEEKIITVFGSARSKEGDKDYEHARAIGREIAKAGYTVMTGGGPGIMEAACRGAKEAGGRTIGLTIQLPKESRNDYLDKRVDFHYFFCRKVMFKKYSSAIIICPGGYGTMDELFEVLTLIQTRKTTWSPLVLFGSKYWKPLLEFLDNKMAGGSYIDKEDLKLLKVSDDPVEAVKVITDVLKSSKDAHVSLVDLTR
jgi:uncharacterized protein (TIGR00730 family)